MGMVIRPGEPYTAGSKVPRIYTSYWFAIKLVSLELIMNEILLAILRTVTQNRFNLLEWCGLKCFSTVLHGVCPSDHNQVKLFGLNIRKSQAFL